ncbi:hypothetical protein [Arenibacter troitsensis]|uniref:Uncharacterized protein n=2 Tax=Arenibacter TaxID=178469 RepID=A0A1X7KIH5_9FLAO|nr:hypothetical protein [Arenibacter troitsensis]SMG41009.1 hypothetical protein SAMN03080602_02938 [Arenibacter troitsensis]
MQYLTTTIDVAFLISNTSPNPFGQIDIDLPIKKLKYNEWIPLLGRTLSQWIVWTGINEPSVKSLPQNYKQDERGKNKASIGHGDSMGIFKVAKVDGDCFMQDINIRPILEFHDWIKNEAGLQ